MNSNQMISPICLGEPMARAGMFVRARIPDHWRRRDTMQFALKLLEEADVAASPGSGFGPAGEGYLRMALVENENRLRQAVRQIGRCLGHDSKVTPACGGYGVPARAEPVAGRESKVGEGCRRLDGRPGDLPNSLATPASTCLPDCQGTRGAPREPERTTRREPRGVRPTAMPLPMRHARRTRCRPLAPRALRQWQHRSNAERASKGAARCANDAVRTARCAASIIRKCKAHSLLRRSPSSPPSSRSIVSY